MRKLLYGLYVLGEALGFLLLLAILWGLLALASVSFGGAFS